MAKRYIINKLGGAFLSSPRDQIDKAVSKMMEEKSDETVFIFVISALSTATRLLDEIFGAMIQKNKGLIESLHSKFSDLHRFRLKELDLFCPIIEQYLHDFHGHIHKKVFSCDLKRERAYVLKYGELMSSAIFTSYLDSVGLNPYLKDARLFISTMSDSAHDDAKIDYPSTEQGILCSFNPSKSRMFVTQGFIGRESDSGDDTVLGYDGSDLSAAVMASVLMRRLPTKLVFWKDVKGVIRDFNNHGSDYIPEMTFSEYTDLKIGPVRLDSFSPFIPYVDLLREMPGMIEIYIRSFKDLSTTGTLIKS